MNNTIFIFTRQILMRMFTADVGLFGKKVKMLPLWKFRFLLILILISISKFIVIKNKEMPMLSYLYFGSQDDIQ